jgi:DNA-directed RNA polymerase specialized sigma subunit
MVRQQDAHFMHFVGRLEPILAEHGENTLELQRYQVTKLVKLERRFRKALVQHKWGWDVYQEFIRHITEVRRNILMARPFFRERDTTFKASISPVLKNKDLSQLDKARRLSRFDFNFNFMEFALRLKPWEQTAQGRKLQALAEEAKDIRNDLVECNLPLAISQARMFLQRNQRSHLNYMDMTQICAVGLMEGIDKFVGPYRRNFRAVIIGRMLGNLIEENSETFVHFFPPDKRRIYRARKIIARAGQDEPLDFDQVCKQLNQTELAEGEKPTTVGELVNLLSAAYVVPASALVLTDEAEVNSPIDEFAGDADQRPDAMFEVAEARHVVAVAIAELSMLDQKLLRLKGVELA